MLKSLTIKNFSLIEDCEIQFDKGLNIITGETGAGKSILLGALSMILGERASVDNIRTGAEKSIIEGVFHIGHRELLNSILADSGAEIAGEEMTARREISIKGQSRCFVNDQLITIGLLKSIGEWIVDLHGQHEHQSLLRQELHIQFLDAYAHLEKDVVEIGELYRNVSSLQKNISDIEKSRNQNSQNLEIFQLQLKEIYDLDPKPSEDADLLQQEKILAASEKLFELSDSVYKSLYESQESVLVEVNHAAKQVQEIQSIDSRVTDMHDQLKSALLSLEDVARSIGDYSRRITFEPAKLEAIRERLMSLQKLKKKFGSIEDILLKKVDLEGRINLSENFEEELEKLRKEMTFKILAYSKAAVALSHRRKKAAAELDKKIISELKKLGIEHAQFRTTVEWVLSEGSWFKSEAQSYAASAHGIDRVEFQISANLGEPLRPLIKVASGGEISRIMLSLKTAIADSDKIPVMVFDEIDVGISGRIAQAVGKALKHLSASHQLICITHLPQIACVSDSHFSVQKKSANGVTTSTVKRLNSSEKVFEVAKLLGGEAVTDITLNNAKELIALGVS